VGQFRGFKLKWVLQLMYNSYNILNLNDYSSFIFCTITASSLCYVLRTPRTKRKLMKKYVYAESPKCSCKSAHDDGYFCVLHRSTYYITNNLLNAN
jgi:hypothetical protein